MCCPSASPFDSTSASSLVAGGSGGPVVSDSAVSYKTKDFGRQACHPPCVRSWRPCRAVPQRPTPPWQRPHPPWMGRPRPPWMPPLLSKLPQKLPSSPARPPHEVASGLPTDAGGADHLPDDERRRAPEESRENGSPRRPKPPQPEPCPSSAWSQSQHDRRRGSGHRR